MRDIDAVAPPPSAALLQALSAHPDQLADVIAALSPPVHDQHSLLMLLRRVAASAVTYLDGVTAAGFTAQLGGPPITVADTGDRMLLLDEYHDGAGDGPCLRAMRTGHRVGVSNADIHQRWPRLGGAVTAHGVGSVLAIPLQLAGPAAAVLSLYSAGPAVPEPDADILTVLTEYAQRGVAAYQRRRQAADVDGRELQQAVAGWTAVEQAVGMLMQQYGFSAPYAREVLGDLAQDWERTLIDQAVHIITTGSV